MGKGEVGEDAMNLPLHLSAEARKYRKRGNYRVMPDAISSGAIVHKSGMSGAKLASL
jgi:hypothetical protein